MAKREIFVSIDDAEIYLFDEKGHETAKRGAKAPIVFGGFGIDNGKISYILDLCAPSIEEIELLRKDERFLEQCVFRVLDSFDYPTDKEIASFEGTFIDALQWLNENASRIRKERREKPLKK